MREQFAVWYPRSADERARFIREGLIALDANVLLHLYRLTPEVREDVLAHLRLFEDRLWIPHQVGLEFHRNRLNVIREQEQTEQKIRTAIDDAADRLHQAVNGLREHPAIDKSSLRSAITSSFVGIRDYLDTATSDSYLSVQAAIRSDEVLDSITDLFNGKVGEPYSEARMLELENEARERFEKKIPPGYEDAKKKGDGRECGDYILWRQLLDEASKRKVPVLLVTNDQKEDWYRRVQGMSTGPRFELIQEMQTEAGVDFHLQTLALFVDTAPTYLRAPLQEATVTEVVRLDELDRASYRADIASDLAVRELPATSGHDSRPGTAVHGTGSEVTVEIARIQARRAELLRRLGELADEVAATRKSNSTADGDVDPRSYSRALEARVEATKDLLEQETRRLADLEAPLRAARPGDVRDWRRKENM